MPDISESVRAAHTSHKLSRDAQTFVKTRLIAGEPYCAIRRAMLDAGYPEVSERAISWYRGLPEVQTAKAELAAQIKQDAADHKRWRVNVALERVLAFHRQAQVMENDLYAGGKLPPKYSEVCQDLWSALREVGKLTDTATDTIRDANGKEIVSMERTGGESFTLATFNDMLERVIASASQLPAGDGSDDRSAPAAPPTT